MAGRWMQFLYQMTISGSMAAFIVILIRFLCRKLPITQTVCLWGIVVFRFLCPVGIPLSFSVSDLFLVKIPRMLTYAGQTGITAISDSIPRQTTVVSDHSAVLFCIWLVGLSILVLITIFRILSVRKRLKTARKCSDRIFYTGCFRDAFIFGIIRPKIILPEAADKQAEKYMLRHEQTHFHYMDHLYKLLMYAVVLIYWFDPLAWVSFMLLSEDIELACDARMLNELSGTEQIEYSRILVSQAEQHIPLKNRTGFGGGNLKRRIMRTLNYRKPSRSVLILTAVLLAAFAAVMMTDGSAGRTMSKISANRFVRTNSEDIYTVVLSEPFVSSEEKTEDAVIRFDRSFYAFQKTEDGPEKMKDTVHYPVAVSDRVAGIVSVYKQDGKIQYSISSWLSAEMNENDFLNNEYRVVIEYHDDDTPPDIQLIPE